MSSAAASSWHTAAELAAMGLPGLPDEPRRLRELAKVEGWAERTAEDGTPLVRERRARGGGIEFNASVLPVEAQLRLRARNRTAAPAPIADNDPDNGEAGAWERYLRLPAKTRAEAERRLAVLNEVQTLVSAGATRTAAKDEVGRKHGEHRTTIQRWQKAVDGVDPAHQLPCLAPNFTGGGREAAIPEEAWAYWFADYLRDCKPAAIQSYNRMVEEVAKPKGLIVPHLKTFMRRLERETDPAYVKARRNGKEFARKASAPAITRSVSEYSAMEAVNVDGHKFDVFVEMEDGEICRPIMCGIQDLYSRKILAWRIGKTENIDLVRLSFFELFKRWGLPDHVYMDNGRAFASKEMTGGAKTRFRFKINHDDIVGVLPGLGIEAHFVTPYAGQSKPIERAWLDVACNYIAKHQAMQGAYTGNKPDAKPDDYRSRAVPIALFRKHVDFWIARHNERLERRTETAKNAGRGQDSFDCVFAASYSRDKVRWGTELQLRAAFLSQIERTCDKDHGAITFFDNTYWCEELRRHAGQKVIARYDPDNLRGPVDIWTRDGTFILQAPHYEGYRFNDRAGAEKIAKARQQARKAQRKADEARQTFNLAEYEQLLDDRRGESPQPQPGAKQPVRWRGPTADALKPTQQALPEPEITISDDAFDRACERRFRVIE